MSSSCVPVSTTRPLWKTTMRSAARIVERRCAMTSAVRPSHHRLERALEARLGVGVDARGRLVEDEERRVAVDARARTRGAAARPR